jgi:5'-deoxynucleotidase YfbR-like HD superfamily hydrolase
MSNFGEIKTKLLVKLTESYTSDNKSDVKELLKQIKSDKNLIEMYLFYEDVENKNISDKETAKLFVEQIESLLMDKSKSISESVKKINTKLNDVSIDKNEIYESLDIISEGNSLLNVEKKVEAKQKLISHLTTPKTTKLTESYVHTDNHTLLNAVLVNNFNTKFTDFLNEEQKDTFKKITSLSESELMNEMNSLKESMIQKFDKILSEEVDSSLINKINDVKKEVNSSSVSKINYYRMIELNKSLD